MRESILNAARSIIAEDGLDGLSMRRIAREIGYSPAALYEYFPAKEDVCCALYFEGAGGLAGRMQSALDELPEDAPAWRQLSVLGEAYRAYALAEPHLYRLAFGNAMSGYSPTEAELDSGKESFLILVRAAAAGRDAGFFNPGLSPHEIAFACWSTVHGFVMLEMSGMITHKLNDGSVEPDRDQADALFASTLRILGEGFIRRG